MLFFPQGSSCLTNGPRIPQEGSFERKSKVLVYILSGQKLEDDQHPIYTGRCFDRETYFLQGEFSIGIEVSGGELSSQNLCTKFVLFVLLSHWRLYFKRRDDLEELSEGNFLAELEFSGDFYVGRNLSRDIFSRGDLSPREHFHGKVFCRRKFPFGWISSKYCPCGGSPQ